MNGAIFVIFLLMEDYSILSGLPTMIIMASLSLTGMEFAKEEGYFVGAMYFAYGLALAILIPVIVLTFILEFQVLWILLIAGILLGSLSGWIFRISRVLWLHFDHRFGG